MGTITIVKVIVVIAGLITGYVNRNEIADTSSKVINIVLTIKSETNE